MTRWTSLIIVIIAGFAFWISCDPSSRTIGKAGSEKISVAEFEEVLSQKYAGQKTENVSFDEKKKVLMNLLEGKLKYLQARKLKLDQKPEFIEEFKRRKDRTIAGKLPEILIADQLATPEKIEANLILQNSKTEISIITLGFQESKLIQAERSLAGTISLAKLLYQRIQDGETTPDLSAEYSDNPRVKAQKGIFSSYTPGMFDPELDIPISRADENQVLKPVVTRNGVFIVKVLSRKTISDKKVSPADREKTKWQIYNKFYRQQGDSLYKELSQKFKKQLGSEISEAGVARFLTELEQWAQTPQPSDTSFTKEQRAIYLGKAGDIQITSGFLIDEFQGTFHSSYQRYNNTQALNQLLTDYIDRFLIWVIKARSSQVDQRPEVKKQLQKFRETRLGELFDKYEVQMHTEPSEEEIAAFYEKNKEKYQEPAKIQMWEIALKNESDARKILNRSRKTNTDFPALAKQHTEKMALKNRGGDLGYQSITSPRLVVKEAFAAGENKIIGPIREEKFYYIIKTGSKIPARQKSLSEVEIIVKSGAQRENETRIREEVMRSLKKEYSLWMNESLLKKLS